MRPEAQRIAIRQVCPEIICTQPLDEWRYHAGGGLWFKCFNNDPLSDLNAMHEAEKVLPPDKVHDYVFHIRMLMGLMGGQGSSQNIDNWELHATAAQRAEAFLRTLNLWTESEPGSGVLTGQTPTASPQPKEEKGK